MKMLENLEFNLGYRITLQPDNLQTEQLSAVQKAAIPEFYQQIFCLLSKINFTFAFNDVSLGTGNYLGRDEGAVPG